MSQPTLLEQGARFNRAYHSFLGIDTCGTRAAARVGQVLLVALFIIGCVGASGNFPSNSLGWTALGLGAGCLLVKLSPAELEKRKKDVVSSAAVAALVVLFGSLGLSGVLTDVQLGYSLMGTSLVTAMASVITMVCVRRLRDAAKVEAAKIKQ